MALGFSAVSGILPQELPCPSFSRHRAYRAAGGSAGFHAGTCGKEGAAFGICKQAGRQDACMARAGGRVFAGRGFERGLAGACAPPGGRLAAPSLAEAKERGRPHRFFCRKGVLPPRFGKRMYFKAKIGNAAIERRCRKGRPAGRRKPGKGKGGRRTVSLSQQKQAAHPRRRADRLLLHGGIPRNRTGDGAGV